MDRRSVFNTLEGVFNVHNSHLWARDNPHAIRERGYQVRFSVSVWAGILGNIVVGPYLLSDRLDCSTISWFSGKCSTVAAWRCASSCEAVVGISARRSNSALWWRCPEVVECDTSGKVDWTWRADCMASLVAGSNSDGFFPVGISEGVNLRSPSQDYLRSRGETSSSCDNGRCQHVKACSRECRAAHCRLPWNGRRPLRTPIVTTQRPWLDHLVACAIWRWRVSWKINVTGRVLYNIFDLFFFNKESHYEELVREFSFILYI
jgi:hypothetical protein